jgi:hypothetical protein
MHFAPRTLPSIVGIQRFLPREFTKCSLNAMDVLLANLQGKVEEWIIGVAFVTTLASELTPKISSKYSMNKGSFVQSGYGQFVPPAARVWIDPSGE